MEVCPSEGGLGNTLSGWPHRMFPIPFTTDWLRALQRNPCTGRSYSYMAVGMSLRYGNILTSPQTLSRVSLRLLKLT